MFAPFTIRIVTGEPPPDLFPGQGRPDAGLEESQHPRAAVGCAAILQTSAAVLERAADGLSFRLARQPGDLRRERFNIRVLQVQGHGYTMV